MLAKLIGVIFSGLLLLALLWAALAFIVGLFVIVVARITRLANKTTGWLWVICFFPFLLLTKKGRNKIKKTI